MPLKAAGSFAAVVNGAIEAAEALRDRFAQRTNAAEAQWLALRTGGGGTGSTTPPGAGTPVVTTAATVASEDPTAAITIAVQGSSAVAEDLSLEGFDVGFIN